MEEVQQYVQHVIPAMPSYDPATSPKWDSVTSEGPGAAIVDILGSEEFIFWRTAAKSQVMSTVGMSYYFQAIMENTGWFINSAGTWEVAYMMVNTTAESRREMNLMEKQALYNSFADEQVQWQADDKLGASFQQVSEMWQWMATENELVFITKQAIGISIVFAFVCLLLMTRNFWLSFMTAFVLASITSVVVRTKIVDIISTRKIIFREMK